MPLKTVLSDTEDADLDARQLAELIAHIRRILKSVARPKQA